MLSGIHTSEFALVDEVEIDETNIALETRIGFGINMDVEGVECQFMVSFNTNEKLFIRLTVNCQFLIEDDSFGKMKKELQFILPVEFAQHLGVITVGTARGILHTKTEDTIYNKFILPAVNLQEALKEDIVFDLSDAEQINPRT